jgi:hypothetical protein
MKLLEPGRVQLGWAKEFHCSGDGNGGGGCRALLLVEQGDLFFTYHSCMGRDNETFVTFRCPQCGVMTDVNAPPSIHDTIWKSEADKIKASTSSCHEAPLPEDIVIRRPWYNYKLPPGDWTVNEENLRLIAYFVEWLRERPHALEMQTDELANAFLWQKMRHEEAVAQRTTES